MIKVGSMNKEELKGLINKYNIKSLDNNDLSEITDFNLMFPTQFGPKQGTIA